MMRPPGFTGAVFGDAGDGDGRRDGSARAAISAMLGISDRWAHLKQVHGADVVRVVAPGLAGEADAMYTSVAGLPMTVATADCLPIVIEGPDVAAIVHAGWRGLVAGVVRETMSAIETAGLTPRRAAIGPAIGPCCYEVGPDVAAHFEPFQETTTDGKLSIDLAAAAAAELDGVAVFRAEPCTSCGDGFHSYRRDGTALRQVAIAWLPTA